MPSEMVSLEKAAKYLCTVLDGLCPMVVEDYPCPTDCTLDTVPWRCWVVFFQNKAVSASNGMRFEAAA